MTFYLMNTTIIVGYMKATESCRTYLSQEKLQHWFLSLRWKICLWTALQSWFLRLWWKICPWTEHSDDDDYGDGISSYFVLQNTTFNLMNIIIIAGCIALYSSPNTIRSLKSRRLRWEGPLARMEQSRNAYRVLVEKPEGKRLSGMPRHRWEDNIKMDLREVGCDPGEWIDIAEDRDQWRAYVIAVMNLRVP